MTEPKNNCLVMIALEFTTKGGQFVEYPFPVKLFESEDEATSYIEDIKYIFNNISIISIIKLVRSFIKQRKEIEDSKDVLFYEFSNIIPKNNDTPYYQKISYILSTFFGASMRIYALRESGEEWSFIKGERLTD